MSHPQPQHRRGRLAVLAGLLVAASAAYGGETAAPWGVRGQVPLNLEPLFDNDAIAGRGDRADGNFDCPDHPIDIPGSVFPAEHLPATGTRFSFAGVHFLFPSKERGEVNNLSCSGQRIQVPPGRYKSLHLVGASENGSFREPLGLAYKEGPAEAELALTDWCQAAKFGERAAFHAQCRYTWDSDRARMVREEVQPRLWLQAIPLDPSKTLEALSLPYNRRMHLFAATLVAAEWTDELAAQARATAELYASLAQRQAPSVEALRGRLDALAREIAAHIDGPHARQLGWLRVQVAYRQHLLSERTVSPRVVRAVSRAARTLRADLEALLAGNDPFPSKRGCFLKAVRSPLDGSLQPTSIAVPRDYTGERPFPLIVTLHGHGWYRPYQGHPQPVVQGVITVAPHGRGSIDYMLAAEGDVLAALDQVLADYRIDADRIVLEGHSMGGTGTWHLGVHWPHRFAALAPVCGNADRRAWEAWKPPRRPPPHPIPPRFQDLRTHLLDRIDPITYAGNLLHLAVLAAHGARDEVVPVGHSRRMARRLEELGCPVTYREFPGVRHWGFPQSFYRRRWDWMMAQRREAWPPRVRYKTASLRHAGAYWVRVLRFAEPLAFAHVDARRVGPGRYEVTTRNVAAFALRRRPAQADGPARVAVDGQELEAEGREPTFVRRPDGAWRVGPPPPGLAKRRGLEGPVADAFLGSFVLVRGTISEDPWEREVIRREVAARARDWERMYDAPPRVKDDTAVTDADIAAHHLVCYGGPGANAIAARVADRLPLRIEPGRVRLGERTFEGDDVGAEVIYPNPLNPDRYVVVLAALSPGGLHQVSNRFGNWFGWGPYDNYPWFDYAVFDSRTLSPETFLCVGFFDQGWGLDEGARFEGLPELRAHALPYRVPRLRRVPPEPPATLMLSDLMPLRVDQHKGAVGYDRSAEGHRLRLGGGAFERGLGVRPPSALEYELGGHYARFRATVGIDLEGQEAVAEARARGERVQFLVTGDGRRLTSTEWLRWDSPPVELDVDIEGVRVLRLEVACSWQRWLVGSADWAAARVLRR
ncbi:MAG: NPCBM/NEW2 domain-containing protein [Candidatus Brocadiia bacterium]